MNKILRMEVIKPDTFVDSRVDNPTMLEKLKRDV